TSEVKPVQIYLPDNSDWSASPVEVVAPSACGGQARTGCLTGLAFCELASGACATYAPTGVCVQKPTTCDSTVAPVCGCDGKTYFNDCERQAAGVPKWAEGPCSTSASCPGTIPVSLTTCSPENMACTYVAPQAFNPDCVQRLTCAFGHWSAPVTLCGY